MSQLALLAACTALALTAARPAVGPSSLAQPLALAGPAKADAVDDYAKLRDELNRALEARQKRLASPLLLPRPASPATPAQPKARVPGEWSV
jgi:hypothetical protein